MRALAGLLALAACSGGRSPEIDASLGDGPIDVPADHVEQVTGVMPPLVVPLEGGLCRYPDATIGSVGSYKVLGDCTVCQCTTYGMRCARRESCARSVCILIDGTELAVGAAARIHCIDCACGADGVTCTRATDGGCPVDACALPQGGTVPVGEQRGVSECHFCECDDATGLSCTNLCHPTCEDGGLTVLDQERVLGADGCSTCVCDYSDLVCERSGCP